jgi:hypothetical protein
MNAWILGFKMTRMQFIRGEIRSRIPRRLELAETRMKRGDDRAEPNFVS